jgi:serine protease Do
MMRSGLRLQSRVGGMALVAGAAIVSTILVAGLGLAQDRQTASFAALPSFADVVAEVNPSVVTVSVMMQPVGYQSSGGAAPWSGTPYENFFGRFGFPEQMPAPRQGMGSGFVIDPDGYIATNNHVVDGAREVTVTLSTGEELPARVVGTDPRTDLALIKVDAGRNLTALRFGDSDRARVGEWVLATGIISARGRDIHAGAYDDFLQIDAAINSGNSGGPVFNSSGEVIGINTAIFSPSGGNVGIGFAIPSNQARNVLDELRENGVVSRGWLGIEMTPVTDANGSARAGVRVERVDPVGPAADAGIEAGDVITRFNGTAIDSTRTLARLVGDLDAGDKVDIELQRDGNARKLTARLGKLDEAQLQAAVPSESWQQQRPSDGRRPFYRR